MTSMFKAIALVYGIAAYLLFWVWRPLQGVVWDVANSAGALVLWGLFGLGWLIALASSFLINHFDFIALQLEERDLVTYHGDAYKQYQEKVPMLLPLPGKYRR